MKYILGQPWAIRWLLRAFGAVLAALDWALGPWARAKENHR